MKSTVCAWCRDWPSPGGRDAGLCFRHVLPKGPGRNPLSTQ